MWVCPSCMMENDDNDLNCYMCGEKRPHIAQVRKSKEPKPEPQPEPQQPAPVVSPVQPDPVPVPIESAPAVQPPAAEQNAAAAPAEDSLRNALLSDFVEAIKPTEPLVENAEPVFPKLEAAPEKKAQEENPFASIFNVPTSSVQPQEKTQEKTQEKVTDDFHTVFNDFLNALQQQEAQQAQAARPFSQSEPDYAAPYSQPQPPVEEEPQPAKRRARKKYEGQTVGGGVFSFMRAIFVVVMFVWSISFVLFALARFFAGDVIDIAYMADELVYLFERGISELRLSDLAQYLVSLTGSL